MGKMSELFVYPDDSPNMRRFSAMEGNLRLAFGCQARVGKDTAVSYLREIYPRSTQLSFAKPLYDIQEHAQKTCGFPQVKDRKFLQWVGTEWARKQSPDVWVDIAEREIMQIPKDTSIFISDLRFPNEMRMLQRRGFKTVRIIRDTIPVVQGPVQGSEALHTSEVALENVPLKDWDYVVYNDGSIEDLQFKLKEMAKNLQSLPTDQAAEESAFSPVLAVDDEDLLRACQGHA